MWFDLDGLFVKDNNANVRSYMYMIGKPSAPHLSSHVVERQGIRERLAGGLDGEVVLVVANGEPGNFEKYKQLTYFYKTQPTSVHRLCRD